MVLISEEYVRYEFFVVLDSLESILVHVEYVKLLSNMEVVGRYGYVAPSN